MGLRAKVSRKTSGFVKRAQVAPMPVAPPAAPPAAPPGAPAAPKAPPAPPVAPPKPDIGEMEKQENIKLDKLGDKLVSMEDRLETMVDVLVDIKDAILGDGKKDKFKELKKEEDEVEEVTSDEFGLEDKSLIVSKLREDKMATSAELRNARKKRLGKDLEFEYGNPPNKKYKQQVPSPTITKLKDAPEDWGQYRMLAKMAMDLSASGDQWSLVNKDTNKVYFTIGATEENQETFATEEFAKEIIEAMKEMGIEAAMKKYSAIPVSELDLDEEPGDLEEERPRKPLRKRPEKLLDKGPGKPPFGKEDRKPGKGFPPKKDKGFPPKKEERDVEPLVAASDFKRRFVRAFRLALAAQQKNLIDNPLKAAWYETLTEIGIEDAPRLIEATFGRSVADHFEVTLEKAEEFLDLSDEGFVESEATIGDLRTTLPAIEHKKESSVEAQTVEMLKARARKSSLPLSTATDTDEGSDRMSMLASALPAPTLTGVSQFKHEIRK